MHCLSKVLTSLLLGATIFAASCQHVQAPSLYQSIIAQLPKQPQSKADLLVIVYNAETCVNCNIVLYGMYASNELQARIPKQNQCMLIGAKRQIEIENMRNTFEFLPHDFPIISSDEQFTAAIKYFSTYSETGGMLIFHPDGTIACAFSFKDKQASQKFMAYLASK